jgi:hypothetical protein
MRDYHKDKVEEPELIYQKKPKKKCKKAKSSTSSESSESSDDDAPRPVYIQNERIGPSTINKAMQDNQLPVSEAVGPLPNIDITERRESVIRPNEGQLDQNSQIPSSNNEVPQSIKDGSGLPDNRDMPMSKMKEIPKKQKRLLVI